MWNPLLQRDIDTIEKVQRVFTKRVPGLQHFSYADRCRLLGLETLHYRRIFKDLVLTYKIIHGLVYINFDSMFKFSNSQTRGHPWKLFVNRARLNIRRNFFSIRVVPWWNSLPYDVVSSINVSVFKKKLEHQLPSIFNSHEGL